MDSPSTYLFVYGTLQTAFSNPAAVQLRQTSQYVGEGLMPGLLYDVGSYPGAVHRTAHPERVRGMVYELGGDVNALLTLLDAYEGINTPTASPDEYVRETVSIDVAGRSIDCWVYLYNWSVDTLRRIESGNYVHYLNK